MEAERRFRTYRDLPAASFNPDKVIGPYSGGLGARPPDFPSDLDESGLKSAPAEWGI